MKQPTLENKRVLLRPMQLSDLEPLLEIAMEPSIWTVNYSAVHSREDLQEYMRVAFDARDKGDSIPYTIFDKENGRIAGCTRFYGISEENKRAEIGYTWLHPDFQRTGLNRAMKFAMLQYAFEVWGLNVVQLKTDERNAKSRDAMLAIGCTYEGMMRKHLITWSGHERNTLLFSILREEWPEIRERVFGKYDF